MKETGVREMGKSEILREMTTEILEMATKELPTHYKMMVQALKPLLTQQLDSIDDEKTEEIIKFIKHMLNKLEGEEVVNENT